MRRNTNLKTENSGIYFAVAIVGLVIFSLVGNVILDVFGAKGLLKAAISLSFSVIAIALTLVMVLCFNGKSDLGLERFNPKYFPLSLLLSVAMFFGFGFVNILFSRFLAERGIEVQGISLEINGLLDYAVYILFACILPAVFEEILFRGVLIKGINLNLFPRALFCGLLFAFYHCSALQFIYQFIYGVALSLLALKSESVFPAVISHFINNFAIVTLSFLKREVDLLSIPLIACGLVAFILFLLFVLRSKTRVDLKTEKRNRENALNNYFGYGLGIAVCAVFIISGVL